MIDLSRHLRAAPTLLRVGISRLVAYRAEMTIWILSATLPLVMLALWNAVAAGGPVAGFGQADIARYFAATLVVRQLTGAWIVWELNWDIRSGGLSPKLLRPMHPLWSEAIMMVAALPFRLVVLAPILLALIAWRPELASLPSPWVLACFGVSIAFAWTIAFFVQAIFGTLAFWFDQSMGLFGVWFGLWSVFSGYIAPLALFPPSFRSALDVLPFRAMLATPVELLAGLMSPSQALRPIALQAAWALAFGCLAAMLWRRGVRRYAAYGA